MARQRSAAGQTELDLGLEEQPSEGGALQIVGSRTEHLHDALDRAYTVLGFDTAAEGDEVFWQLVLARVIEPAGKKDSLRVLAEVGIEAAPTPRSSAICRTSPSRSGARRWRRRARPTRG